LVHPHAGTTLRIFPEVLTQFTIRVFGAFYLSLALGALTAWLIGRLEAVTVLMQVGIGITVPTLAAAVVFIGRFRFSEHPGHLFYVGAYVGVLVLSILALVQA